MQPRTTKKNKKTYSFQWTERLETKTAEANVLNACINLHLLRAVQAAAGTGSEGCWIDVSNSLDFHSMQSHPSLHAYGLSKAMNIAIGLYGYGSKPGTPGEHPKNESNSLYGDVRLPIFGDNWY